MSQLQHPQNAYTDELLSTKLTPPRLRTGLVLREPLLARLDEGLEHKLTLLSAPPGFGKTTLVSQWLVNFGFWILDFGLNSPNLNEIQNPHSSDGQSKNQSRRPPLGSLKSKIQSQRPPVGNPKSKIQNLRVAWVSLDAGDNDPVRFWRYVITACQAFDAAIGRSSLVLLLTSPQPSLETVLTTFINELAHLPGRSVLVLEDYHVITPAIPKPLFDLRHRHPIHFRPACAGNGSPPAQAA